MKNLCVLLSVVLLCVGGCDNSTTSGASTGPSTDPTAIPLTGPSVLLNSDNSIAVGDTVSIDIVMKDFPESQGGGLNLEFDPQVVQVNSVAVDQSVWGFYQNNGEIDNGNGKVSDIVFAAFPAADGDGRIVTVSFQGVAKGDAQLRLSESSKNPFASNGKAFSVSYGEANLSVK